jgi:hypothetical protein
MSQDDLKKYTVKVGEGSGCLFQPMTDKYTYILTAKHLFEKKEDDGRGDKINIPIPDGTNIPIKKQILNGNFWTNEPISFTLIKGETYFPHKEADIAILRIEPQSGFGSIHIQDSFEEEEEESIHLCGFPDTLATEKEQYSSHRIEYFIASGNYCHHAKLFGGHTQETIVGMSGGGLLKIGENGISIIGVQSKMASSNLPMGQIGFVPMRYAKEIVDYPEYKGNLEKFLPIYFKSFKFLKDDIFKLQAGLPTMNKANKMSKILNAKAIEIQKSSITPIFIRNYLKENLPSVYKYGANEIQNKKLWSLWLELLTILNIAKKYSHCSDEIPEILKKVRLIYSNVNSDFWIENLHKLHKVDFRGLEINGTVVVASNIPAVNNFHVLRLENIPGSIAMVQGWRDDFDLEKIAQRIDSSTDFPLEKYKFVNISAFKEGILENDDVDFENKEMLNCIEILEKLYEQLFTG